MKTKGGKVEKEKKWLPTTVCFNNRLHDRAKRKTGMACMEVLKLTQSRFDWPAYLLFLSVFFVLLVCFVSFSFSFEDYVTKHAA